jgi:MFS family permease
MAEVPPTGRAAGVAARLGPFRHRPFTVYWLGGTFSNMGTWLQAVAGSIFVYQLTGSALAVGILNFAGFMPILLFSVLGGVISDRFDRRNVTIVTHVISGLVAVALAVATFGGVATEVHLIAAAFAINTSWAIAKPSVISILPGLVPRDEVTDAVGLNTLQFILGQVGGPALAALVMATAGAGWAFTLNGLTYLAPILSMVYLHRRGLAGPEVDHVEGRRVAPPTVSSTAFVREHPWVVALLAGVVATSVPLEIIRTLSPALAVESLGEPESAAGLLVAAQSVGSAVALAVFVPLRKRGLARQMAATGLLVQAVGLLATAFAPSLAIASIAVSLIGFGFSLCFPILTGTLQAEVPDNVRGRIMALHQMSHLGNRPLAALAIGTLATLLTPGSAVLAGLVLVPVGLVAADRAWKRLRADAPPVSAAVAEAEAILDEAPREKPEPA